MELLRISEREKVVKFVNNMLNIIQTYQSTYISDVWNRRQMSNKALDSVVWGKAREFVSLKLRKSHHVEVGGADLTFSSQDTENSARARSIVIYVVKSTRICESGCWNLSGCKKDGNFSWIGVLTIFSTRTLKLTKCLILHHQVHHQNMFRLWMIGTLF